MEKLSRENLIKHWLLNTAIDFPRPLLHVLPAVRGISLNARQVPRGAPEEGAHCLQELFLSGHILFTSEAPTDDVQSISGLDAILTRFLSYSPEPREVRHARGERSVDPRELSIPRVEFALTESGGALWESAAKPDWNHFYDQSSDYETGEAVSPDLTLLMARLGWFPELTSDQGIDIQSLQVEEHAYYPILYWKKLPHVFRATFKCQRTKARWSKHGPSEYPIQPEWFRKWWPTTFCYYTHPWELPEWQQA